MILMNGKLDVNRFIKLVEEYDICEYVYYSLYYACAIFDYEVGVTFEKWCKKDLMYRYGLKNDEYKVWENSLIERIFDKSYINKIKSTFTEKEKTKIFANEHFMRKAVK